MALEPENAGSIWSLIRDARENARAQRSAISSEAWESLNSTWLQVQNLDFEGLKRWGYRDFFDWVKERSHLFRGVVFGTMLHDDAFRFIRLGTFIERADNTARILDVKYHVLLPEGEQVGGYVDYYQWGALLRSVGAFRAYRKVYHDTVYPWRIAELLILREDMPRSLHHCYGNLIGTLDELAGKKELECRSLAGQTYARLKYGRIDRIFRSGLHEFLHLLHRVQQRARHADPGGLPDGAASAAVAWRGRHDHVDPGRAYHRLRLFGAAAGEHAIFAHDAALRPHPGGGELEAHLPRRAHR